MYKFLILSLVLSACSFKKNNLENQTQKGHEELYSEPSDIAEAPKNLKRIVIAATNDMEGAYAPQSLEYSDASGSGSIQVGGVDFISSYFNILRKKYSNVLLLDSGDIFSSEASQASTVGEFYSALGYDAVTIGLSDFNVKIPKGQNNNTNFFKAFAKTSKTPLLLSNLYDLKSGMVVEWEGSHAYIMKEIDGTKIGIIGLVPDDVVSQTPVDNRVGLYVESMLQSTLDANRGKIILVTRTCSGPWYSSN
jgi:2',3'-cyclic-nucleotide 2'-phosphodiesterase (5'-nucleotidase family)